MTELVSPHVCDQRSAAAIIDSRGALTWLELSRRVSALASALDRRLKIGEVIAAVLPNGREFFELMLASLIRGYIFLPLNWHSSADELAYMLRDSGARLVAGHVDFDDAVEDAAQRSNVPRLLVDGRRNDSEYETLMNSVDDAEAPPIDRYRPVGSLMFYTSGTTGQPKGVRFTEHTVELLDIGDRGRRFCERLGIPPGGVTLVAGPLYHAGQVGFARWPLAAGSTVVAPSSLDAAGILEAIMRFQVTNVHLVPTNFYRMLSLPDPKKDAFDPSSLVRVFHGGAPCPPHTKQQMIDWWGPVFVEYYASTETGAVALIGSQEWLEHPGSVGKPVPEVDVIIADEDGEPLPLGREGTIYVRSRQGSEFNYHNSPQKTSSSRLRDGYATVGDIGWMSEDGYLYISDRRTDMINSGGVNIYPAEIENVLISHPDVVEVAVFGVPNEEFGEEVRAVVELKLGVPTTSETEAELISYCRERLAAFKAPRAIAFEERLDRSATGKLDKLQLRACYSDSIRSS